MKTAKVTLTILRYFAGGCAVAVGLMRLIVWVCGGAA
jgi:hypothetical protein